MKKTKKFTSLFKQLIIDLKPKPERLNISAKIEKISIEKIADYCKFNKDSKVLKKLKIHELIKEPIEEIIVISQKNGKRIKRKYLDKILTDLGYNVNVLLSKSHGSDDEAAINIGGYSVIGWQLLINLLRKFNTNLSTFLGKRFAPGRSRLHIRIFEGRIKWYFTAHIDEFNWTNINILGIKKSHKGYGQGDYTNGTKYFFESLIYYFKK